MLEKMIAGRLERFAEEIEDELEGEEKDLPMKDRDSDLLPPKDKKRYSPVDSDKEDRADFEDVLKDPDLK